MVSSQKQQITLKTTRLAACHIRIMLKKFYHNYLAKDRALRHYSQHLLFAVVGFFLVVNIFDLPISDSNILLFFLFTYLPDVDSPLTLYFHKKWFPFVSEIIDELKKFRLEKVALLMTKHHKQVNRSFFHNVIGLLVVVGIFILSIKSHHELGLIVFGSILTHFIFDILDDLKQLGHIRNWIWFF